MAKEEVVYLGTFLIGMAVLIFGLTHDIKVSRCTPIMVRTVANVHSGRNVPGKEKEE